MVDGASIGNHLRQQGIHVSDDFVRAAAAGQTSEGCERTVFEKSLCCDFNVCGLGCLPNDIESWNKQVLVGRVVLQVDEVVDMASNVKQRYDGNRGARCLKLYMTDGKVHVCGFEQEQIPDLAPLMQAGVKVALQDVLLRRGLMALTPRTVKVLGGKVDRLEEARQRAVERWRQPVACNSGAAGQSLYEEATAAAWPVNGSDRPSTGHEGNHAAPAPSAVRAPTVAPRSVHGQAAPQEQAGPQQAAGLPGRLAPAPLQEEQVAAAAAYQSPEGALESPRQNGPVPHQRHEQERLDAGHVQATATIEHNPDQGQGGAHAADSPADADIWSSADPYWDAVEEHPPPADEVVELSGNDDSSEGLSAPNAAMQQVDVSASRPQAPDQLDVTSRRGQSNQKSSNRAPSQPSGAEDDANAEEISTFAAVTEMASNLQFLDEHKEALQHYSMEVRIEERATGDEHIACVHPSILEKVLGMTPAEMRDFLAQGQHERVRERISCLKHFLSTFAGQMLLRVGAAQPQPVICHFGSPEDASDEQELQLVPDPSMNLE